MARGHEDWQLTGSSFGGVDLDSNELAVRLGAPFSFYRTGKILWATNFARDVSDIDSISQLSDTTGVIVNSNPFIGQKSFRIKRDGVGGGSITLLKQMPNILLPSIGVEIFLFDEDNGQDEITIAVEYVIPQFNDAVNNLRYDIITRIQLKDYGVIQGGIGQSNFTFPDGYPNGGRSVSTRWHVIKVIFDLVNHFADHVKIGAYTLNTNLKIIPTNVLTHPYIEVRLFFPTPDGGNTSSRYLSHWVITTDEPLLNR